jgi:urease accessory protein
VTTQSAEKIYRADAQPSDISVRLKLERGAHLAWLPQETLLFSGSCLQRRFEADLAAGASLDLVESVIFGRGAMGEQLTSGSFQDRWRIKRDGRLIYADHIALQGDIARALDRLAIGKGARAIATFLCIAPDAEARLDAARSALSLSSCECGASAWNGMLVARFAAIDPAMLRRSVIAFLENFRAVPMPRVWQC